ncbi:MAG: glycosyltransferase [Beijerinckiaceae bacterium]|nr:glycosyltransferase [Beijerinckiaceae bacterium]
MPPTHDQLLISVVICTRNRADRLKRALDSIAAGKLPVDFNWEVIVVDNGGTDHTQAVVEQARATLPVVGLYQPAKGKSNACNMGIEHARGAYILWTDDDVTVSPNWLTGYADGFRRDPDAVVFGGEVRPVLEEPVSDWFSANAHYFPDLLAKRENYEGRRFTSDDMVVHPYGANYAVRAAEQKATLFNPTMGPGSELNIIGEEKEVISRALRSSDGYGVWLGGVEVFHHIGHERQSAAYVGEYYDLLGRTIAWMEVYKDHKPRSRLLRDAQLKRVVSYCQKLASQIVPLRQAKFLSREAFHRGRLNALRRFSLEDA